MMGGKRLRLLHACLMMGVAAGGAGRVGAQEMRPPQEHASRWVYQTPEPLSEKALHGQRLYLDGVRADGRVLSGQRQAGNGNATWNEGAQVACVQCHRRTGLGTVEGDILIAPITGRALYEPGSVSAVMDTRSRRLLNTSHAPYTLESLGQALRQGVNVSGRSLHPLMPRYQPGCYDPANPYCFCHHP
jgi:cytochrome c553